MIVRQLKNLEKNENRETVFHTPALLNESIKLLNVKPGKLYYDLTVGGGGSSLEILKRGGEVFAIDQDPAAVAFSRKRLSSACPTGVFQVIQANFVLLEDLVKRLSLVKPAGILLDLGTSHFQIKQSGKGFTFEKEEPLDMRMDPGVAVTAADLVNGLGRKELTKLFRKLGEESRAGTISKAIVLTRKKRPIKTSRQLAKLVFEVYQGRRGRLHPATKVFQALRIAVNDELNNLREVLPQALTVLKNKGRLVVISFHGLEDKIVKNFFREEEKKRVKILTKKPISASRREVRRNVRARSAKLRAVEKI